MTVLFRRTFSRADASVPFYKDPAAFTKYITDTYVKSGKCLTWRDTVDTETGRVTESVWASQTDMDAALLDSELLINADLTNQYCSKNSITSVSTVVA